MRADEGKKRLMAYSAAVMYGAAATIDLVESLVPGGQSFSLAPGAGALVLVAVLGTVGRRLPLAVMAALGPLGVALIAAALASTDTPGDGAILYTWPVLWEAYFFGRRGTVLILASVGVAHALYLLSLPDTASHVDRWIDVMASVTIIGVVVEVLSARNQRLLRRISDEARVDELTGLLNRRGFDERAATELARARRDGGWIAVATFDLDYFKRVNDEFGHDTGDRVLVRFAECLQQQMREIDVIARMGGEEFLALLPGTNLASGEQFAERVREALSSCLEPADLPRVTTSAGVAAALAPAVLEDVLKAADMALYAAKAQGRNRTALAVAEPTRVSA